MTNAEFIKNDIASGDFVDWEVKAILKALKLKKYADFLEKEYAGYTAIEDFYSKVL